MYVKEGNNHSVKSYRTIADTALGLTDGNMMYYVFSNASKRDVTLEMRMKMGEAIDSQQIFNINLYGKYEGVRSSQSYFQMHFYASKSSTSARVSVYNPIKGVNESKSLISNFASPDEWFDF